MTERLAARGIMVNEYKWDDGPDHDNVTKIYVGLGDEGIRYIYCDYVKSGIHKEGSFHGLMYRGFTQMFEIDHLRNEHLESVEGYYAEPVGITALQFKTNFRTSELFGFKDDGTKFTLQVYGKKIIGFHGSSYLQLGSLGAYVTWITPIRLDEKGGKGGKEWDDGSDHDDISKIHVRGGSEGIQFIRFDYVKDYKGLENGSIHGVSSRGGFTQTFEIDYRMGEYLVYVEGYYDYASGIIQGLQFKTNMQTFDMMGYEKGRKFTLEANGFKIIGFHGYAEKNLNSLGVYFTTQTPNKLKCQGLTEGLFWDDGSNNDGIRKVYVDDTGDWKIRCIRVEYVNDGKVEKTHRRYNVDNEKEFVLDYPNELITSVEGTMSTNSDIDIRSLRLKTSKGRTISFGSKSDDVARFVLEKKGLLLASMDGLHFITLKLLEHTIVHFLLLLMKIY